MQITIIGAGRLGSALARRSVAFGHETHILCRSLRSRTNRLLPAQATLECIAGAKPNNKTDLVLIAAPAYASRPKEELITVFLRKLESTVAVCSGVAYTAAPSAEWARGRPFLQFVCSSALANTQRLPLVLVHGTNRVARARFSSWLGPASLHYASKSDFERLMFLLAVAPLHAEILRRVTASMKIKPGEQQLIAQTLLEAYALMEIAQFEPVAAIDACSTPRGFTRDNLHRFLGAPQLKRSR